jgi:hypothetical protein
VVGEQLDQCRLVQFVQGLAYRFGVSTPLRELGTVLGVQCADLNSPVASFKRAEACVRHLGTLGMTDLVNAPTVISTHQTWPGEAGV